MYFTTTALTGKQRVQKTFAHEKCDRMPVNYLVNPGVHRKLAKHLGISEDMDTVCDVLGVDFKELMPSYKGPALFDTVPGRRVDPLWGHRTRWVGNESGGYWDYCDFPLQNVPEEVIAAWPLPNPDDFDYDTLQRQCSHYAEKAVHLGHPGLCDIMNSLGMLRGMEDTYADMLLETEAIMVYLDRRLEVQLGIVERALKKCGPSIDFIWTGEDLGTQNGPLISMEVFRKQIRPRHKKIVELAAAYKKPVMIHSCGSSSWAFEEFVSMGIAGVDTLQPEAAHMEPAELAKTFGERLMFHGCISTAKLAQMTPQQICRNVQEVTEIMRPYRGYCIAPTHMIQDNTPVENIVALYESARQMGRY